MMKVRSEIYLKTIYQEIKANSVAVRIFSPFSELVSARFFGGAQGIY